MKNLQGRILKFFVSERKLKDVYRKSENFYSPEEFTDVENIYNDLTFDNVAEIGEKLMNLFTSKSFDKIVIVYNKFINAASQEIMTEDYLPIIPTVVEGEASAGDYIFEPSKSEIVEDLIPKSLKIQLFKGLLDSHASEHGARMTAMHKATDNAGEMKDELTLSYNKARQAAITNEILEIVGGAEALNG